LGAGSSAARARTGWAAGPTVVHRDDVLPAWPALPGKGEALWRSLAATDGDVLVFVDADLRSFSPSYVTGLLGPLLTDRSVHLVKGLYERPFAGDEGDVQPSAGGRVTD